MCLWLYSLPSCFSQPFFSNETQWEEPALVIQKFFTLSKPSLCLIFPLTITLSCLSVKVNISLIKTTVMTELGHPQEQVIKFAKLKIGQIKSSLYGKDVNWRKQLNCIFTRLFTLILNCSISARKERNNVILSINTSKSQNTYWARINFFEVTCFHWQE